MAKASLQHAPKLGDVAKAAGLAPATVSRFLNGGIELPEATAARIHSAIASLGYRPNPYARSLSRGRSDVIGLAIPDIQNPFFAKLASAIDVSAEGRGLGVLLCSTLNRSQRELDYVERLRRNFFDGLLFATNRPDTGVLAEAINEAAGNIVIVDEDVPGARVSKVFSDNVQGGELAGRHMIEAGHRNLAYIGGPPNLMSAVERGEGFRRAVREAGPDRAVKTVLLGDYSIEHGRAAMRTILGENPDVTGIFVGSDEILLGVLSVMRERALKVGRDVSVITFDDVGPLDLLDPPITAIRQPVAEIGQRAFELIVEAMSGSGVEPVCERLPVELVVRSSVGPPRADR